MIIQDQVVGVIFVFRTYSSEPNPNDSMILQSFADQAAIAVFNARLYQRVSEEQQRLVAILDHNADGVLITDGEQRIVRFNKALGRITGRAPAEALGQLHDAIIVWERVESGSPLGAAVAQGWPRGAFAHLGDEPLAVEGELRRPDGSLISLGITYAALTDDQGDLRNIIANVRDITHFRKAQEAKSAFISGISHELKTPVALIKGWASTLRRDDVRWERGQIEQGLTIIEDEADRLTELIENLLASSKLQAEGMRLTHVQPVDLVALAGRVAERFRNQTAAHALKLDFPKKPPLPRARGDEARLRQILDNLVSNAIKYSPDGGEITIGGASDARTVTVFVRDQGVGIPHDELPHIFERFYRVDDALSRNTQGAGLGLYLAQALAKAHGGQITVQSQPGKGSTFRLTLPKA
jgi:signal transduction histidine kinase